MRKTTLKAISYLTVFSFVMNPLAFADEAQLMTMLKSMQKQMADLQTMVQTQKAEIQELKSRGANIQMGSGATSVEVPPPMSDSEFKQRLSDATGGADKWLKDLKFKGDMRLRYEAFNGSSDETDARNRFRYRLRFGFDKKFSDEMNAGFSLASGEAPTTAGATAGSAAVQSDPTSTNTSFDNDFDFKPIYVEKVYASYSPDWAKIGPVEKFNITAGKMDNPFEKGSSDIIWDRDVKPEGIYEKIDLNLLDTENFDLKGYGTLGQFVLDEDGNLFGGGDANLFAYQIGLNPVFYTPFMERPIDLLSAVSWYDYSHYAIGNNFTIGGVSLARGNPAVPGVATELAAKDFNIVEFYHELAFYPWGIPVRPFLDWAWNPASEAEKYRVAGSDQNAAYAYGVKLGGLNKKGDWEASYAYKSIGANAVPGFNDSDFGYTGHSNKFGNVFKLGYALTDYLNLNAAAFFVNNRNAGTAGIRDEQQNRYQLDLSWKF